MRKNIENFYLVWGLGLGGTGRGWFHYFMIFMFGSVECSKKWPEPDRYWAGTYKDLIPLFRSRYEEEHINFVARSGSWLGWYWTWFGPLFQDTHVQNYRM